MKRELLIKGDYIYIPVLAEQEESWLSVYSRGKKIFEFAVSWGRDGRYDYTAAVRVPKDTGGQLVLEGDFDEVFFDLIEKLSGETQTGNGPDPHYAKGDEVRPDLHFTPRYGWINDPNGLVFDGAYYHLYFQHNPFNTKWNNMSWGHAVSKDLVHFTEKGDVLFPDENGTMFSGCGLKKNGELLFPYTVAGASSPWSEGKPFYQGLAVSRDGGETLEKMKTPLMGPVGKDSRDPKIFWHDETKAYIMLLYLEAYDFGIFRSRDLKHFEMTQRFSLEPAWECPDLLRIKDEDGSDQWMFICADGFYYWGDFDGYTFTSDLKRQDAYLGGAHYATQTYYGIEDRIVAVPWLRLDVGHYYRGAMGIPREYSSVKKEGKRFLVQKPVREIAGLFRETDRIPAEGPFMVEIKDIDRPLELCINGSKLLIDAESREITIDGDLYKVPVTFREINIMMDLNIMELAFDNVILLGHKTLQQKNGLCANWRNDGNTKGCGGEVRADGHYRIKSIK